MVKVISQTLFLCVLFFSHPGMAVEINVTSDRDIVSLNDSITILFQTNGAVDGDPDFSPLTKDFEILGNRQRSNLSIINGQRTSSKEWQVELMAKRAGKLVIPPIEFGQDKSPAKAVTVIKGAVNNTNNNRQQTTDSEAIFLEVEISPESPWVQAQVLYTIRLFRSVNTANSSLTEPDISGGQVVIENLGDREYETYRSKKRFIVTERRYALFPQSSGEYVFNPIVFKGQVNQRSSRMFDPFGRSSKTLRRTSKAYKMIVQPKPDHFTGNTWLPALNVEVQEMWSTEPTELVVGEPVTRTIIIKAKGLTSGQLPELKQGEIDGFKSYPDQPALETRTIPEGVYALRQEKSALIANVAGEMTLPGIEIPWWNTQTGQQEVAKLLPRTVTVLPAKNSDGTTVETPLEDTKVEAIDKLAAQSTHSFWPWLTLLFGLGWLLTLFLLWKRPAKPSSDHIETKTKQISRRKAIGRVQSAVEKNDLSAAKDAVLSWAKTIWADSPPRNLTEIAYRSNSELALEINQLNQALYAERNATWNGANLTQCLREFSVLDEKTSLNEHQLQPLYKTGPANQ